MILPFPEGTKQFLLLPCFCTHEAQYCTRFQQRASPVLSLCSSGPSLLDPCSFLVFFTDSILSVSSVLHVRSYTFLNAATVFDYDLDTGIPVYTSWNSAYFPLFQQRTASLNDVLFTTSTASFPGTNQYSSLCMSMCTVCNFCICLFMQNR